MRDAVGKKYILPPTITMYHILSNAAECYMFSYHMTYGINISISTLEGQGSISCGQYLDRTFSKFSPIYGPHLTAYQCLFETKWV